MTKDQETSYLVRLANNTTQHKGFIVFYEDLEGEVRAYECSDLFRLKESIDRLQPTYKMLYAEPYFIPAEARRICESLRQAITYRQRAKSISKQIV